MKSRLFFLSCFIFPMLSFAAETLTPKIVGYVPAYQNGNQVEYSRMTHAIFAFLELESDGGIAAFDSVSRAGFTTFLTKTEEAGCERLISINGAALGQICQNNLALESLVENLAHFCVSNEFDGVDVDWEGIKSTQDSIGFEKLMNALDFRFEPLDIDLVATVGFTDYFCQYYSSTALHKADWMQVMVYDGSGTWEHSPVGNHASFQHFLQAESYWTSRGFLKAKMVMGVPFYGYKFHSTSGGFADPVSYREIVRNFPELLSSENQTPGNDLTFFNGPDLIRKKCKYILEHQFAGIMIWEMTQDTTGEKSLYRQILCAFDNTCDLDIRCEVDLSTGLVAEWNFSGNADDVSGHGLHGINDGAQLTRDRFGNRQSAFLFDRSAIDCGNNDAFNLRDFTISAWFRTNISDGALSQTIVQKFDAYPGVFAVYLKDHKLKIYLCATPYDLMMESNTTIEPGVWYHAVVAHNSTVGTRIYLNGALEKASGELFTVHQKSSQHIRIGSNGYDGADMKFYGTIDDMRIYNQALEECSIDSLYTMPNQNLINSLYPPDPLSELTVFPNPSTGQISVTLPEEPASPVTLTFTNAQGQLVLEKRVTEKNSSIVHGLKEGVYTVSLLLGDKRYARTLVVGL